MVAACCQTSYETPRSRERRLLGRRSPDKLLAEMVMESSFQTLVRRTRPLWCLFDCAALAVELSQYSPNSDSGLSSGVSLGENGCRSRIDVIADIVNQLQGRLMPAQHFATSSKLAIMKRRFHLRNHFPTARRQPREWFSRHGPFNGNRVHICRGFRGPNVSYARFGVTAQTLHLTGHV